MTGYLLALLIGLLAGLMFGWQAAHITVAAECEKLGGFFVGSKVYECKAIGEKHDKPA